MRISDWSSDVCSSDLYQGVIPLEGDSVAHVLESYMRNSEQLDTRLWLAADSRQAAGLLLQRLPGQGGTDVSDEHTQDETWERARHLAATVKHNEQIGRAHVLTPVTNAHLVCRLLLEKKKKYTNTHNHKNPYTMTQDNL